MRSGRLPPVPEEEQTNQIEERFQRSKAPVATGNGVDEFKEQCAADGQQRTDDLPTPGDDNADQGYHERYHDATMSASSPRLIVCGSGIIAPPRPSPTKKAPIK